MRRWDICSKGEGHPVARIEEIATNASFSSKTSPARVPCRWRGKWDDLSEADKLCTSISSILCRLEGASKYQEQDVEMFHLAAGVKGVSIA